MEAMIAIIFGVNWATGGPPVAFGAPVPLLFFVDDDDALEWVL